MTATELTAPRSRAFALVRALRPHQWVKNLLVFVPVVLDHKVFDPESIGRATTAFLAFCCAASGAYVLNDLLDLEADRRHPTKRHRPFASGLLSPALGLVLVPGLLAIALAASWSTLPRAFLELLAL